MKGISSNVIKVSVIVPVYNVDKYLRKCLDSLVNQTLKEIEIIVINDGSTDDSQCIIDEYQNTYPDIIRGFIKSNGGLSDARNYGLPFCRGEYIGFVDSDDYVDKRMYELMYTKGSEDDSDMVTCDYYMVYGEEKKQLVRSRSFESKKDMLIAPKAAAWNKIYRRSMIMDNGIIFPKGLIYEDTLFYAKCVLYTNRVTYVPSPLVYYVQRRGSIANTQGIKTQQIFAIFDKIIEFYKDKGEYEKYFDYLEYFCTRIALGSNLDRVSQVEDKKMRGRLATESVNKLKRIFPQYKKNSILCASKSLRHIFIKYITEKNVACIATVLHLLYTQRGRKLYG